MVFHIASSVGFLSECKLKFLLSKIVLHVQGYKFRVTQNHVIGINMKRYSIWLKSLGKFIFFDTFGIHSVGSIENLWALLQPIVSYHSFLIYLRTGTCFICGNCLLVCIKQVKKQIKHFFLVCCVVRE